MTVSRRQFNRLALGALPAYLPAFSLLARQTICRATEPMELGPYHRDGTPVRTILRREHEPGDKLTVRGIVRGEDGCSALADVIVDVWQADASGRYDFQDDPAPSSPAAYRMRGITLTDGGGHYAFETVLPGHYGERARHIHYLVQRSGYEPLITQLYFEGDPRLTSDPLVRRSLTMPVVRGTSKFDLVLRRERPLGASTLKSFEDFIGEYKDDDRGYLLGVVWRDGSLMMHFGDDYAHLRHRGGTRFLAGEWAASLTFVPDDTGRVTKILADLDNGKHARLTRVK
jgi:protocatechuate 3,4-dioxygenase beta subunit